MNNTITARVIDTQRAGHSINGNPSFWVTLQTPAGDTVRLRTTNDAGLSYGINNAEYRDELHVFHLTRAGRIRYAQTIPEYLATTDGKDSMARAAHNSRI